MSKVIVVEFVTADGVVRDPDGSDGTTRGGWAFRAGPEVFAGDKFGVGPEMRNGVLLFGRATWEMFSTRWPTRTGEFPDLMNSTRKVVVSRTLEDVSAWNNSVVMAGELAESVTDLRASGDVVVVGSISVAHALAAADLVDQYRLIVISTVVGEGDRLFPADRAAELTLVSVTHEGATASVVYDVVR